AKLFHLVPDEGGVWKERENAIYEFKGDGTRVLRFQPVRVDETPAALDYLHDRFAEFWDQSPMDKLLLIPAYILDFLCIHPFKDGNGRMSRLLTALLLSKAGYDIGRYFGLEEVVERRQVPYYDALQRCSQGWHESHHPMAPCWEFFLGIMLLDPSETFDQATSQP
ncbi:MAG: Fic family protein, partial [bacterium]